jgi:putative ABC transport system substrate-binding protein
MLVGSHAAHIQPAGKVPKIGVMRSSSATAYMRQYEAFSQGLRALGYIEGQNIAIERRFADGRLERLPALAAELATLYNDVVVVNVK